LLWLALTLSRAQALLATGVVAASGSAALIALGGSALAGQTCLFAAWIAAVTLPMFARRAHHHFGVTTRTLQRAPTDQSCSLHCALLLEPRMIARAEHWTWITAVNNNWRALVADTGGARQPK